MGDKPSYQAVNAAEVEKLLDSPDFIHREKCACGVPIFTFRRPGETLEGRIWPCAAQDRFDRARTAEVEYYRNDKDVRKVAIRLNKRLRQTIEQYHLWGQEIRITYKGSIRGKFPNAEKIYLIELQKGTFTDNFERVQDGKDRDHKPRARRPIRRPATGSRRKSAA